MYIKIENSTPVMKTLLKIIFSCSIIFISFSLFAKNSEIEKAQSLLEQKEYNKAYDLISNYIDSIESKGHIYALANVIRGKCLFYLGEKEEAKSVFNWVLRGIESNYYVVRWQANLFLGEIYADEEDVDIAMLHLEAAWDNISKVGHKEPSDEIDVLERLIDFFTKYGNKSRVLKYASIALNRIERINDFDEKAEFKDYISSKFRKIGFFNKAINIQKEANQLFLQNNRYDEYSHGLYNIAFDYQTIFDHDKAIKYYLLSKDVSRKHKIHEIYYKSLRELGIVYSKKGQYNKSIFELDTAIRSVVRGDAELKHDILLLYKLDAELRLGKQNVNIYEILIIDTTVLQHNRNSNELMILYHDLFEEYYEGKGSLGQRLKHSSKSKEYRNNLINELSIFKAESNSDYSDKLRILKRDFEDQLETEKRISKKHPELNKLNFNVKKGWNEIHWTILLTEHESKLIFKELFEIHFWAVPKWKLDLLKSLGKT